MAEQEIEKLKDQLKARQKDRVLIRERENNIEVTDEAVDHIATLGFDTQFGARSVKGVIQNLLVNDLSKALLKDQVVKDKMLVVDCKNNEIVFLNRNS